ncbi:hypothetical protein CGCSCA5_v007233 [Colletotrichum siamense]|nr:hypothetical protein CGCSCA5_v007233 [Colletotrichum siamense]
MSGTEGPGSGGLRPCGPKNYMGVNKDGIFDAVFMIPYKHIEQVFILPNVSKTFSKEQAYEVIIVPTGATGSSSIKREYPQMISFTWPEKQADKELGGTVGEAADGEKDTYGTILKKVLNDQLKAFDKEVIDLCEDPHAKLMVGVEAFLSPPTDTRVKSNVDSHLHFLNQGILFTANMFHEEFLTIFLPFHSLENVILIEARDSKRNIIGLNLICGATEPFYKDKDDGKSTTLMCFPKIDQSLMGGLQEYLKEHNVKVMLCEQSFYDYEKDVPMTSWMPLMKWDLDSFFIHMNIWVIFFLPWNQMKQVIVIPNLSISVTKDEAFQIIIVPTGAVGVSSVKREYPQIISFSWPDKMADKDLHSHEAANSEKDTYLFVFVRAMNDHLKPFNKAVIDLTSETGNESVIVRTAILSPPTDSRVKTKTRGQLYLMDQGIMDQGLFFNSQWH